MNPGAPKFFRTSTTPARSLTTATGAPSLELIPGNNRSESHEAVNVTQGAKLYPGGAHEGFRGDLWLAVVALGLGRFVLSG